jgi:hypothetical protein
MKPHFFVSSAGGDLFDTRAIHWSHLAPLRKSFRYHSRLIETPAQFKATLRAGSTTDLGGYPLYFVCDDGATLCFKCARIEARTIIADIGTNDMGGWNVVGCEVNYESAIQCEHCNESIASAYGDDESADA